MQALIKHLLDFLKSDLRLLWKVTVGLGAVNAGILWWPEITSELPAWAKPSLALSFVFFAAASLTGLALDITHIIWKRRVRPFFQSISQKRAFVLIQEDLLELTLQEVSTLSEALARENRALLLNPDHPVTILLEGRGIIIPLRSTFYARHNEPNFQITENAWQAMLMLDEFSLRDGETLLRQMNRFHRIDDWIEYLPQSHQAIATYLKENRTARETTPPPKESS
ncbi:super-infection exclusion protein B [Sulfitobacter sp. M21595]|uniref:super-infection exclusion protein B n=1 Tax=Sulfitobacter sp. M21595 TaxID=3368574 RepID=UPI0037468682